MSLNLVFLRIMGFFLIYNVGLFSEISFGNADKSVPQEGIL